jgi:nucleotide-binding universal stress UspA family protein
MKILVPVDGSPSSKAAIRFIVSRLTPFDPRLRVELLNVQPPIPRYPARLAGAASVRAHHATEANKVLAPALAPLKKAGVDASARYVVGSPGTTIGKIAARDADLVVMGAHGHTAMAGLVVGSVTSAVLASCATPLLIVRGRVRASRDVLKVGVAVDGSRYGAAAVRYFLQHINLFGRAPAVTLIHVVPDLLSIYVPGLAQMPTPAFSPEQAISSQTAQFEAAIKPVRKLMKQAGLAAAETRLIGNGPGDKIAAYATQNKFDLLVMGSHGYGAFKSVILGSVATRVAAKCQTPLLLIRTP